MKIEAIFSQIDGLEFESALSTASGLATFQQILANQPVYHKLVEASKNFPQKVADHLLILLKNRGDSAYTHPHDVAIAAYLLALVQSHPTLVENILNFDSDGLFWTRFVIEKIKAVSI